MNIQGNVAIVTGGISGLGRATAQHLSGQGAHVVLLDLHNDERFTESIRATYIACDVTDEKSVKAAIQTAASHGPLACVVNCAGVLDGMRIVGKEGAHDLARFERVIKINLLGTFNVLRLAAEHMSEQPPFNGDGERGVIINTASIAAFEGQIGQAAYAASKGGVAALTLPASREFTRFGIRVVTIAPGLFETPMMQDMPEKVKESLIQTTEFPKRLGQGEEYAKLVAHIIDNAMLNGCVIRLDGGIRLMAK